MTSNESSYKDLALEALARAEDATGVEKRTMLFSEAQAYWAAHNAEMVDGLGAEIIQLRLAIGSLTDVIHHMR